MLKLAMWVGIVTASLLLIWQLLIQGCDSNPGARKAHGSKHITTVTVTSTTAPSIEASGQDLDDKCVIFESSDCFGQDLQSVPAQSAAECCDDCARVQGCIAFSFAHSQSMCYMKEGCSNRVPSSDCTAGTVSNPRPPPPVIDIRVSKGLWARGYGIVRLSAITQGVTLSPALAYHKPFAHRWTSRTLNTEIMSVGDEGLVVDIDGQHIKVTLPSEGSSVTGLLVADPCFSSLGGLNCPNGERMQIREHLTQIVNQLVGSDAFDYWGIIGDNFYDRDGKVTDEFFQGINLTAKVKPFLTVPGNHDFWIAGGPPGTVSDNLGYGFMQFYAQDTVAAAGTEPFNFSGNPDNLQIAAAENFIYGTQIGDIAFFGYSGAHYWEETRPHAASFCEFVGSTASVHTVIILGHWNFVNLGAEPGMDAGTVRNNMANLPGCRSKRLLYFDGHEHCNRVCTTLDCEPDGHVPDAHGFMIGGTGMYGAGCSEFGFAVVQSDPVRDDVRVDYFKIAEDMSFGSDPSQLVDNFEEIFACLKANGYTGCRDRYAQPFRSFTSAQSREQQRV